MSSVDTGCHRIDGSYLIIHITADDEVGSSGDGDRDVGGARVAAWDPRASVGREGRLPVGRLPSLLAHWRALCARISISHDGAALVVPRFVPPTPPSRPVPVAARAAEVRRRHSSSANGAHVYTAVSHVRGVPGAAPFVSMMRRPDGALGIFVQEPASGCTHTCVLPAGAAAAALDRCDGPAAAAEVYHGIVSRLTLSSDSVLFIEAAVDPAADVLHPPPPPPPSRPPPPPDAPPPRLNAPALDSVAADSVTAVSAAAAAVSLMGAPLAGPCASSIDTLRVPAVAASEVEDDDGASGLDSEPVRDTSHASHREDERIGTLGAGGISTDGQPSGSPLHGTRPRSADHAHRSLRDPARVPAAAQRGGGGGGSAAVRFGRPHSADRARRPVPAHARGHVMPHELTRRARPHSAELLTSSLRHRTSGSGHEVGSAPGAARVYRRPRSADMSRPHSAWRAAVGAAHAPYHVGGHNAPKLEDDAPRSRRPQSAAVQWRARAAAAAAADAELASRAPTAPAAGAALCGVHAQMFFAPPIALHLVEPIFAKLVLPVAAAARSSDAVPGQQHPASPSASPSPLRRRRRPQSAAAAAQRRHAASWVARAGAVLADAAAGPLRTLHARSGGSAAATAVASSARRPRVAADAAAAAVTKWDAAARPPTTRGLLRAFVEARSGGGKPLASAPVPLPPFRAAAGSSGGAAHVPTVQVYRKLHGHGSLTRLRAPFPARDAAVQSRDSVLPAADVVAAPLQLQRRSFAPLLPPSTGSDSVSPFEPPLPPPIARGRRWAGDAPAAPRARGSWGGAPLRAGAGEDDARLALETARLRAKAALAVGVGETSPLRVWERRRLGMSLIGAALAQ